MTDREIIEWVAQAKVGDALPAGIDQGSLFAVCVRHGAPLGRGRPMAALAPIATVWARRWLEDHPRGRIKP